MSRFRWIWFVAKMKHDVDYAHIWLLSGNQHTLQTNIGLLEISAFRPQYKREGARLTSLFCKTLETFPYFRRPITKSKDNWLIYWIFDVKNQGIKNGFKFMLFGALICCLDFAKKIHFHYYFSFGLESDQMRHFKVLVFNRNAETQVYCRITKHQNVEQRR